MTANYILIVDDEPDIRQLVGEILEDEGYQVALAKNAIEAREARRLRKPDLVLLDIWMPGVDGITLLKEWQENDNACCPVIMMSGHATIETAVESTRLGAYDFIEKPLSMAKMLLTIENALRVNQLEQENRGLRRQVSTLQDPVGLSEIMQKLRSKIQKIAQHNTCVIFYGEPGVGKESFAHYLHHQSPRKERPFVKAILSSSLKSSFSQDLFGYEKRGKVHYGLFDEANGGVLYLARVEELDKESQARLLIALRDKRFKRIGGTEWIELSTLLIVSSSHDLQNDVKEGKFREDLYFQLNALPLLIPNLRQHPEDVPELLSHYVDVLTLKENLPYRHFSLPAQNFLRNHSWPGNIRELKNLVQHLLILGTEVEITLEEAEEALGSRIPVFSQGVGQVPDNLFELPLRQAREQFEHDYLIYQLKKTNGNVSQLAQRVKMERTHLYRKMRALSIDPKKYSRS